MRLLLRDFERRMRANGSTLVGSKMHYGGSEYKVTELDVEDGTIVVRNGGQDNNCNIHDWLVVSLQNRLTTGFSWRMK